MNLTLDMGYIITKLQEVLAIPSPSGDTNEAISFVAKEFENLGASTRQTNKGVLIATLIGENDEIHRTLSAHIDTLGAMVAEVKSNGRLKLTNVGGYMWNAVEGENCYIKTSKGKVYTGTILTTKASTHVHGADARKLERQAANMEVRLDEQVKSKDDTLKLGIRVGDFVAFDPRTEVTPSGFIKSRHLDDKASVAVLLGAAKFLKDNNIKPKYTTHFFITNNEEIGHGASYGIPEKTVEFLAVDMGCVGDGLEGNEYAVSVCAKDSSGPYHIKLRNKLTRLCEENKINYVIDVFPYYGSDASAALRAGADIVHGLIGQGVDASHAYERTHKDGIENTAKLVVCYMQSE